jgi:hypothetical protein
VCSSTFLSRFDESPVFKEAGTFDELWSGCGPILWAAWTGRSARPHTSFCPHNLLWLLGDDELVGSSLRNFSGGIEDKECPLQDDSAAWVAASG